MADDARGRWAGFLDKVESRQGELLAAARESLPTLVPASDYELTPFGNALTAVHAQCVGLSQKIDRTWSDSAEAALEAAGADLDEARALGLACAFRMSQALRTAEVEIAAAAAEALVARAQQELAAGFKCTRCGAPLHPKQGFFRSHYVPCEFCRTMNTFEPGMAARMIEHFAAHALGEHAALEMDLRFLEAEHRFRERSPGAPTKEALVDLYAASVDAYLAERARLVPELAKDLEKDRRAKLDAFVYSIA